jgi:DHA2 family multidrug resistance protein-like MFS transporter
MRVTFEAQAEDAAEAVAVAAPVTHMADDAGLPIGLAAPRLYWSVLAIWLAMGMAVLDGSIANVALPTIARELGATPAGSIWVLNANQLAVTMMLMPAAALGDIFGCRRTYLVGLAIFVAASLACTFATSLTMLAIWRGIAGLGAAAIVGTNAALVRFTYSPERLGRGVGYNTLVIAMTSAAGPTVAAGILAVAPWQALFAVNVPLGLGALLLGSRALPLTPRSNRRFDFTSAGLSAAMFAMLFFASSALAHGDHGLLTAGEAMLGLSAGYVLFNRARGQAAPLIPLDLLRIRILRLSYFASLSGLAAYTCASVALPFFLDAHGYDHVTIGLLITPLPVAIALTAPIAGRLTERIPAGVLGGIGLIVYASSMILLARLGPGAGKAGIMGLIALSGVGFAMFQTPNNRTMIGSSPPRRSGAAAGMAAVSKLIGQTSATVVMALLFRLFGPASIVSFYTAAALATLAAAVSLRRVVSTG